MITVLGGSGFIGSHVVRHLERAGLPHQAPTRGESLDGRDLGHIIYCIGLTADFRQRPSDAVDAHVCTLLGVVRRCAFESILYLSSARVYLHGDAVAHEDDVLHVHPERFEDLYNASKIAGESVVLSLGAKGRVARPSTVYGAGQRDTFLAMLLEEAQTRGTITLRTSLDVAKDYIRVEDVARLLVEIALRGRERVYNIASGMQITNAEVTNAIARITGCSVTVAPDASTARFPAIDNARIRNEFAYQPASVLDDLPALLRRTE